MPIAQWNPEATPREPAKEPTVVAEPGKHEIYDHRLTPLWSLDAFLDGSPWEVTFFQQRLGANDAPRKLDVNLPPSLQAYTCTEKLQLIVNSALNNSYNAERHEFTVEGVATVPSFIQPNVDDLFYAVANLGRLGLFYVKRVERLTYERESAYNIEYALRKEITKDDPEYMDLQRKIVEPIFVYSKQRLIENRNPILVKQTYQDLQDLRYEYLELVNFYFTTFLAPYEATFIVPGQPARIYDPYLNKFILNLVSPRDTDHFPKMNLLSLNQDEGFEQPTIWSLMTRRGLVGLSSLRKVMGTISPYQLQHVHMGRNATFGNTDMILYPMELDTSMKSETLRTGRTSTSCNTGSRPVASELLFEATINPAGPYVYHDHLQTVGDRELLVYDAVTNDPNYIFSGGFYQETPNSLLEVAVLDYLRRSPISMTQLKALVALYPQLHRLEQFYFGPFLMALIKEADRGAHA